MSDDGKYRYTRNAEAEIEVSPEGALTVRFCDANIAQWNHDLGTLAEWGSDRDELIEAIEEALSDASHDLAESLVNDLFMRVLSSRAATS